MREPSQLEPFIVRLERLGIPYFVTGSMAGIARLGLAAEWARVLAEV